MFVILKWRSLIWAALSISALALCCGFNANAQIGSGSLEFSIDGVTATNGYSDGGTGASVDPGTPLTGGIAVNGVTGNGGTTTVTCYANGSQIFSWSTSNNGQTTFTWSPSSPGSYVLYCEGDWAGNFANGTVDTPTITIPVPSPSVTGYINPKYVVVGVDYVIPGASSYSEYCNDTSVSSTNTIKNTFSSEYQQMVSVNVGASLIKGLLNGTFTNSYSSDYTQSTSSSSSVTISQSTSLCNRIPGAANNYVPNNHDYDTIWLWLNPVALLTYTEDSNGNVNGIQWNGWAYNMKDQSTMEVVPILVGCLNGDLYGCSSQLAPLSRTWDNDETWPSGEGPALTSQDYANILAADPFAACEPSTPLSQECSLSPDPDRFTLTYNQDIAYFQPPVGGQPITTIYQLAYTDMSTQSQEHTISNQVAFGTETSLQTPFLHIVTVTVGSSQKFTNTTEADQSVSSSNQKTATASVTEPPCNVSGNACFPTYPSSDTPGPTEFEIYQDNLYGTYLYFPANWQN